MQAEARRHGVAAPFRRLAADLVPWSMHISVSPLDTRFLHLVRLMDPGHVRAMLAAACPMRDPASARSHAVAYTVTAIRYRPGQRHVLRYDRLDGSKGTVFAKLYTGEDGERVQLALSETLGKPRACAHSASAFAGDGDLEGLANMTYAPGGRRAPRR